MKWKIKDNSLFREFKFKDFLEAMAFMNEVANEAEKMQHHPLWTNEYNRVSIWLTTHDAGNIITEKDKALSEEIDKIFDKKFAPQEQAI